MSIDPKTVGLTLAAIFVLSRIDATRGIVSGLTGGNRYWR